MVFDLFQFSKISVSNQGIITFLRIHISDCIHLFFRSYVLSLAMFSEVQSGIKSFKHTEDTIINLMDTEVMVTNNPMLDTVTNNPMVDMVTNNPMVDMVTNNPMMDMVANNLMVNTTVKTTNPFLTMVTNNPMEDTVTNFPMDTNTKVTESMVTNNVMVNTTVTTTNLTEGSSPNLLR